MELADRLVGLNDLASGRPERLRERLRVIHQSATPPPHHAARPLAVSSR